MIRFVHTADWQLGLKLNFIPGEAGGRARAQRFETVRKIAELARRAAVDCVVVAGDVLDDNGVGADTLQLARDALQVFHPVPVLLLPGNHDAATPDCALARLGDLDHVHVLLDEAPVAIAGARFFPCPLRHRHERGDPTRQLPERRPGEEEVWVAIAHGAALEFGAVTETPNRIDTERVIAKGFDYLALGDWHGTFKVSTRVWYAGAPEATRFKEKQPGKILLVEIASRGHEPAVTALPVTRTRWLQEQRALQEESDLNALQAWFDGLEERSWTLVSLTLQGALPLAARARLDALVTEEAKRLLHLQIKDDGLVTAATDEDLALLGAEGFVGAAADRLRHSDTEESEDALRLLYRFLQETG